MIALSHHETADTYAGVIAEPADGWRVIICKNRIQWILQRRRKGAGRRWEARGYFRTRKALIRLCTASCGQIDPAARCILDALPENFTEGAA